MPEGKLVCTQNGKYVKWYQSVNGKYTYIPKSKRALAEKLAAKNYLMHKFKRLSNEYEAINAYQKKYNPDKIEESFFDISFYSELLSGYFKPFSKELEEWMHAPYIKNTKYLENLKHRSISGNTLRSKSEAIIDMTLYEYRIPFRYECELNLGNITIYPDFTIRHPETGEIYYWEHCGLIENHSYQNDYIRKLRLYLEYGIIPSINLILTYENYENPFTIDQAIKIIENYFL